MPFMTLTKSAVECVKAEFPDGAQTVCVAINDEFRTSSFVSPNRRMGPILLADVDGVDGVTADEIIRLGPTSIVILTESNPPQALVDSLEQFATVSTSWVEPYPSWTLDANGDLQPPTPCPTDGGQYAWNEEQEQWDEV